MHVAWLMQSHCEWMRNFLIETRSPYARRGQGFVWIMNAACGHVARGYGRMRDTHEQTQTCTSPAATTTTKKTTLCEGSLQIGGSTIYEAKQAILAHYTNRRELNATQMLLQNTLTSWYLDLLKKKKKEEPNLRQGWFIPQRADRNNDLKLCKTNWSESCGV